MVFNVILKPVVFLDVEEAVVFYKTKSDILAENFYKFFLQALDEIKSNPEKYAYVFKPVRRHIIKKYPYKIYYIVEDSEIIIIGMSHAKRSNRYIKLKLKNR